MCRRFRSSTTPRQARPHDARYLFGEFAELMRRCGAKAESFGRFVAENEHK